jgi:hypothetical protein
MCKQHDKNKIIDLIAHECAHITNKVYIIVFQSFIMFKQKNNLIKITETH